MPPMQKIVALSAVKIIFVGLAVYFPLFIYSQKTPVMPSEVLLVLVTWSRSSSLTAIPSAEERANQC
jgi:hypothetical protein